MSYVPTQHKICESGHKQVVIDGIKLNAADKIVVLKRAQLTAWQANNNSSS